ncbi:MAG: preprotein translocase subunit SecA [Candidatus Nealsonbacteria bacterium CG02_land_8_20_14_3_00_37_10]|uniref:Protein translocase subunit SecA n=1 Tax=Candidatus Nealsonbacteria bacterium CG02_land_8_20_14_3_00_37_10 TaxID=1974699 RepID=A0A2M7D8U5_9BACT|nr:MAG: preprotein translocase subunit SecA [Candidatus Nealsonbacteria bacterium CG02_land_8_20_14_3_00_37_10]
MSIIDKIFGDANEKYLKKLEPAVKKINSLEKESESFSSEQLKGKTNELKAKLNEARGCLLDDLLPEAFALVREASKRTLKQRHFDVQMIGGIVLHQGKIAEMKTGEGKTLAATLSLYLNALEGKGCHLITVNDYLARRDTVWMGQIYHLLGLSTGCIVHDTAFIYDPNYQEADQELDKERDVVGGFKVVESYLRPCSRKEAYLADITYGTNNEFGFDYLRDNMAYDLSQQVQRGFNYAIVDEVDSILIDEARTPLIISAPDMESSKFYQEFAGIIPKLDSQTDYMIDEKMKTVTLTELGVNKVEKILGLGNIYEEKGMKYLRYLEQALRAETLFKKDKDYVVKDGEIIIVDEFTGRLMPGRRWSGGLHQAIEAKEGVFVNPESLTLASITFQNYFRMYRKLAGMTGTAATSAEEFDKVYKLEVIVIPTNKPMRRADLSDRIYKTEKGKFEAAVKEIKERHKVGQPVLVGTTSIEKNEHLGRLLEREGIPHQILNAKHHEKEGQIIAQAGRLGQVTIATNMAGRGVDIILGGNPADPQEAEKVKELGGLHVIGTERHEARRIDNQLRGRTGRQGDSGSSQFFISLEDDLMRIFASDKIKSLMTALKIPEDQPIEARMVSGAIESAQGKIEGMNFDLRKHILDYDDVMNKHREIFYRKRKEVLEKSQNPNADDPNSLKSYTLQLVKKHGYKEEDYEKKEKEIGSERMRQVEKVVALRILDMLWLEHLENMDYLRDSVRLRAYGQRDPLIEYKSEGHKMFQDLLKRIEVGIANTVLKVNLIEQPQQPQPVGVPGYKNKPGRNDSCPCGSGKKYKRCCMPKYG